MIAQSLKVTFQNGTKTTLLRRPKIFRSRSWVSLILTFILSSLLSFILLFKRHIIPAPPPHVQHVTHNSFTFIFNGNITGNVTLQAANKNEEQK